jgi:hypothetical protein
MPDAFEGEQVEFMRGKIASGLGQGQYFLTREGYSRQFLERLGFVPFPGTLNVLLEGPFTMKQQAIKTTCSRKALSARLLSRRRPVHDRSAHGLKEPGKISGTQCCSVLHTDKCVDLPKSNGQSTSPGPISPIGKGSTLIPFRPIRTAP